MNQIEIVLVLLAVVAVLVLLADELAVPYPVLLVIGGLALGFVPALPDGTLKPDLVFLLFLPPLLYWEAVTTSWRDFRANLRPIVSLAVGLVVFTTCGVAAVAHLVLGLPWALAFVLGAVVSSTDAVAAIAVTSRLGVPQRIVTILAGEGLVNDATALVVYGAAVAVVTDGTFSLAASGVRFVAVSAGGVAVGLFVGWALVRLRGYITDVHVEGTIGLLTPFAAYIPAELIGVSGVLAAVAAGLYIGRQSGVAISSAVRLQADAVWELGTFVLNGLVFILIGLEFHGILSHLSARPAPELLRDVAITSLAVIGVRLAWVYPAGALIRLVNRRWGITERPLSQGALGVIGWAGMRGVISLATALALPDAARGAPFPDRDLLIFITFGVILVTLSGQGLTLAPLIRWLDVSDDGTAAREEAEARLAAAQAALAHLDELSEADGVSSEALADLRAHYTRRVARFGGVAKASEHERVQTVENLRRDLLDAQRRAIIDLRDRSLISDEVLRRVQRELDLERVRLDGSIH